MKANNMNIFDSMSLMTEGYEPDAVRPLFRESVHALLIDDDAVDASLLQKLTTKSKQFDFYVEICRNIEDGRTAMQNKRFDIAFVDYWLGYETSLPFIHCITMEQDTPCILLTGFDKPEVRRVAFRAGVAGFLSKEDLSIEAIESVTLAAIRHRPQLPPSRAND